MCLSIIYTQPIFATFWCDCLPSLLRVLTSGWIVMFMFVRKSFIFVMATQLLRKEELLKHLKLYGWVWSGRQGGVTLLYMWRYKVQSFRFRKKKQMRQINILMLTLLFYVQNDEIFYLSKARYLSCWLEAWGTAHTQITHISKSACNSFYVAF